MFQVFIFRHLICISILSCEYATNLWPVIRLKTLRQKMGILSSHLSQSAAPDPVFFTRRALFGSDILFVIELVMILGSALSYCTWNLTAVWFYSVWHLLYQTHPECPVYPDWMSLLSGGCSMNQVWCWIVRKEGLVPRRCLCLSSRDCCWFHLTPVFVDSPGPRECSSSLGYDHSATETWWGVNTYGSTNTGFFFCMLDSGFWFRHSIKDCMLRLDSSSVNL